MSNDKDNKKETLIDYPTNRKTERHTPEEREKKVTKVVTGKVKKKKRGFGKKMSDVLLEDDTKSVGGYIMYDILIPAAKELINDMIGGGVEMLLFGEQRRGGGRSRANSNRPGGRNYVNYGSYSSGRTREHKSDRRELSYRARTRHDFDEIILDSRGEAVEVLDQLLDLIDNYNAASVADLYDLVGVESDPQDDKYGWYDLRNAEPTRARGGGYLLDLPRPKPLD